VALGADVIVVPSTLGSSAKLTQVAVKTRMWRLFGPAAVGVIVLAGCSTSSSGTGQTASTTDETATTSSVPMGLTAFGATKATWNLTHEADPTPRHEDSYYPRLPNGQDKYQFVSFTEGRVSNYTLNFDPPVTEQEAEATVAKELPSDATVVANVSQDPMCHQTFYIAPELAFEGSFHGTELGVLVELQSGTTDSSPYDPTSVTSASFGVQFYTPTSGVPC
jgi:hypothetical protein